MRVGQIPRGWRPNSVSKTMQGSRYCQCLGMVHICVVSYIYKIRVQCVSVPWNMCSMWHAHQIEESGYGMGEHESEVWLSRAPLKSLTINNLPFKVRIAIFSIIIRVLPRTAQDAPTISIQLPPLIALPPFHCLLHQNPALALLMRP